MRQDAETIAIAGGGVIGLSTGWQLLRNGYNVALFDKGEPGKDTSDVGAGMLAPNAEAIFEEEALLKYNRQSLSMFEQFLEQLAEDSKSSVPAVNNRGSLMVALDRDDNRILQRLYRFRKETGLSVEWLTGTQAREREPLLSPRIISALWLEEDCEINNLRLIQALLTAYQNLGGIIYSNEKVENIDSENGQIRGLATDKDTYSFDKVIIAAGSYSSQIRGIPEGSMPPLRPVKGQIIDLQQSEEVTLSCMVRSPRIYLVPKSDGRLLLGATSEEKGFDTQVTAGGMWYLLDEGWHTVPGIYELPQMRSSAGLRPASPDHRPIIGNCEHAEGLYLATGFFRHGFLLMPLAAYGLCSLISGKEQTILPECFLPKRFNS